MSAQPDTYMPPEHGWTCFHCGDTFMREVQAREHFGGSIDATPGCMLKLEKGDKQLLRVIRGLEAERDELRRQRCEEDSELLERASNEPPSGLPAPNVAALMSDLLDWASDAEDDETNNNGSSIVSAEGLRKLCYRAHAALSASAQPPRADEALELKRLITGYVNAYDAGLSRHENVELDMMRKIARKHDRATATKCEGRS